MTITIGDVNEDGTVDNTDVGIVRDQIISVIGQTLPADVNNYGVVNVIDLQGVVNKL